MVRVYVASPLKYDATNDEINHQLGKIPEVEVFLPASLYDNFREEDKARRIAEACYDEIDQSDVVVVVEPFGLDVAAEVGYTIARKRSGDNKLVLFYQTKHGPNRESYMLGHPDFKKVDSIAHLVARVARFQREKTQVSAK
ncbi:MAG TPA: nucleoside 2-deoxyribosyltransferase [Ktedonobacterales bacterium]|nr:nucleoside 2-deoxyribosyltransferase [Ktedonobacterales bacterium]